MCWTWVLSGPSAWSRCLSFIGFYGLVLVGNCLHTARITGSIPVAPTISFLKHLRNSSPRKSLESQLHANGPDWTGKDSVTAHWQHSQILRFDRGPIPYSGSIQVFTGTMPAPLRDWNKNTCKQLNWWVIHILGLRSWLSGWDSRSRRREIFVYPVIDALTYPTSVVTKCLKGTPRALTAWIVSFLSFPYISISKPSPSSACCST